jgi:hypothetical protein
MKDTEYSKVPSLSERRDSTSDGDEEEGEALLLGKSPLRDSYGSTRKVIIILSLLNIIVFGFSSLLFGTWYYNNYLVLNAKFRRTSAYSESQFHNGPFQTYYTMNINYQQRPFMTSCVSSLRSRRLMAPSGHQRTRLLPDKSTRKQKVNGKNMKETE